MTTKRYYYTVFGLTIQTDIPSDIWATEAVLEDTDIQIITTAIDIPEQLKDKKGFEYKLGELDFLLKIDSVATFRVKDGNEIHIDVPTDPDWGMINLYLTGSVISMLLTQRAILSFHGNAINVGGKAVLFCGDSGAGKSSVAAGFWQAGYPLLTDDVCAIDWVDDSAIAYSSYPHIKLWKETIDALGIGTDGCQLISGRYNKYYVPIGEQFYSEPLEISTIVVLEKDEAVDRIEVAALTGMDLFKALINNTHRPRYIQKMGASDSFFKWASRLSQSVKGLKIKRADDKMVVSDIIAYIERNKNA